MVAMWRPPTGCDAAAQPRIVPSGPAKERLTLVVHWTTRIDRLPKWGPFAPLEPRQPDVGRHVQKHHQIEVRKQRIAPAGNRSHSTQRGVEAAASDSIRNRSGGARLLRNGGVVGNQRNRPRRGAGMPAVARASMPGSWNRSLMLRKRERAPKATSLTSAFLPLR